MRNRHSTLCSEVIFEVSAIEVIVDFFATLHVELIVVVERDELITEDFWTSIFWDFWVEVCNSCEANRVVTFLTADFFIDSHADLTASIKRCELTTDLFACCSRLCLRSIFLKLNVYLQCRHADNLFVDSDVISSARDWRVEHFSKVIASNATADSNIDFWDLVNESCDFCEANDLFSISHTKLTALIKRWEFLTSFRASWLRICSYNFLLKLKLCLQNLQITRTHVISEFDALSVDSDIVTSVHNWRFELFDEARRKDVSAEENAFERIVLKRFNEVNFD